MHDCGLLSLLNLMTGEEIKLTFTILGVFVILENRFTNNFTIKRLFFHCWEMKIKYKLDLLLATSEYNIGGSVQWVGSDCILLLFLKQIHSAWWIFVHTEVSNYIEYTVQISNTPNLVLRSNNNLNFMSMTTNN